MTEELTIWIKPDGKEIELNNEPATVAKARELGWVPAEEYEEVE